MTSALLKLPQKLSRSRKEERVEQILEELVCPCTPHTLKYNSPSQCRLWPGEHGGMLRTEHV